MNLNPNSSVNLRRPRPAAGTDAFTMVEVALSLAIVAFAMVAIIGVMPAGLNVQKENREDTIISQDAALLLEAIRGGAASANLTVLTNSLLQMQGLAPVAALVSNTPIEIVKRLSIPRWDNTNTTGYVQAHFRSMSGNLADTAAASAAMAFSYVVTSEVTNYTANPGYYANPGQLPGGLGVFVNNLYEVKLTFQWPVYDVGASFPTRVGDKRLVVRTLVSGQLTNTGAGYLFTGATFLGQ
jgi:type II secretory pathway pseudopilin PulG